MKQSTKRLLVFLSILAMILICAVPLFVIKDSEFGGADGQAEDVIAEIDPTYEPWFNNVFTLPGSETESLLFALQAAMGAGVFCYFIGYFVGVKKTDNKSANETI